MVSGNRLISQSVQEDHHVLHLKICFGVFSDTSIMNMISGH